MHYVGLIVLVFVALVLGLPLSGRKGKSDSRDLCSAADLYLRGLSGSVLGSYDLITKIEQASLRFIML
jgi:hypothetical protein